MPPVTVMVSPVIYEASSEHKNAITPPISSGLPSLKYQSINKINWRYFKSIFLNMNCVQLLQRYPLLNHHIWLFDLYFTVNIKHFYLRLFLYNGNKWTNLFMLVCFRTSSVMLSLSHSCKRTEAKLISQTRK